MKSLLLLITLFTIGYSQSPDTLKLSTDIMDANIRGLEEKVQNLSVQLEQTRGELLGWYKLRNYYLQEKQKDTVTVKQPKKEKK